MSLRSQEPRCKECHSQLYDWTEVVTEYCSECVVSDKQCEVHAQENWDTYMQERYDRPEANR